MGIQRLTWTKYGTKNSDEGRFVMYRDHLSDKATALREQREGIALMVAEKLERLGDGLEKRTVIADAIRAYAGWGEESP